MKFKPITKKYKHSEILIENIPEYMQEPVLFWIRDVLADSGLFDSGLGYGSPASVDLGLTNRLNILFRESFPSKWSDFVTFILSDDDRLINFIGFCLQNFAYEGRAKELEQILSDGGSAWAVILSSESYQRGGCDLVARVPEIVEVIVEAALMDEDLLREAWIACYSRNPDYEKTVSKAVDVLEGLFRDKFFPQDPKPVLTKFLKDFEANPTKLSYKGDNLVNPKNLLTDVAKEFVSIRGQHTKGTGRLPNKHEAEFVLHYAIFVWNMFR